MKNWLTQVRFRNILKFAIIIDNFSKYLDEWIAAGNGYFREKNNCRRSAKDSLIHK